MNIKEVLSVAKENDIIRRKAWGNPAFYLRVADGLLYDLNNNYAKSNATTGLAINDLIADDWHICTKITAGVENIDDVVVHNNDVCLIKNGKKYILSKELPKFEDVLCFIP